MSAVTMSMTIATIPVAIAFPAVMAMMMAVIVIVTEAGAWCIVIWLGRCIVSRATVIHYRRAIMPYHWRWIAAPDIDAETERIMRLRCCDRHECQSGYD